MKDEILRLMHSADAYSAVQLVERDGTPHEIAERFQTLVPDLYWQAKHLGSVVALAQGGIHYCLARMESGEADDRDYFGSHAKGLAYNLASFTWPGWDEPGVAPTACEVASGFDAAKLNLRLAVELRKPADRVRDAHWLMGAHHLAANEPAAALDEFRRADPGAHALFHGYALLAQIVLGSTEAQHQFDKHLAAMPGESEDERTFCRSQLATAHHVFVGTR